jgi:thiosulfate/3-mercaptopyruvate sulfurtransferase
MAMPITPRRNFVLGALGLSLAAACRAGAASSETIGPLLQPAALAARLDDVKSGKIAVLYVGPDLLFGLGHVPGARKVGAAGDDDGARALSAALAAVPAETEIVLYCGCCPVSSCPNVRPASAALRKLGRTRAYVLDLPTKFATDWVDRGYPVEPR